MKGLTKKQASILTFIDQFIQENGHSPSYREIQHQFQLASLGSVYTFIKVLKRKGAIQGDAHASRSLNIASDVMSSKKFSKATVPFVGYIAAGFPIETFPKTQIVNVPESFIQNPEHTYALRAIGDTLHEELIADGDLLIIEARQTAVPGETVVGTIHQHQVFVKRYFPEGELVRLEGRNPQLRSELFTLKDVRIQGVLLGVLRQMEV